MGLRSSKKATSNQNGGQPLQSANIHATTMPSSSTPQTTVSSDTVTLNKSPIPVTPNNTPVKGVTNTSIRLTPLAASLNRLPLANSLTNSPPANTTVTTNTSIINTPNIAATISNIDRMETEGTVPVIAPNTTNDIMEATPTGANGADSPPAIADTDVTNEQHNSVSIEQHPLPSTPPNNDIIVVFDLETTGLPLTSDICQIAAQQLGETRIWSRYLVPNKNVSPGASRVNGLTVKKDEKGKRVLTKKGQLLPAENYISGLKQFHKYLVQLSRKSRQFDLHARIILVAHNGRRFDAPILLNAFRKIGVTAQKLDQMGVCFADSLTILRDMRKENPLALNNGRDETDGKERKLSLSLISLYRHFFEEDFPAHDACEDVKALRRVLFESTLGVPESLVASNTFKPQEV